jgi:hypothetical protein
VRSESEEAAARSRRQSRAGYVRALLIVLAVVLLFGIPAATCVYVIQHPAMPY